jgi:hypothetical protein
MLLIRASVRPSFVQVRDKHAHTAPTNIQLNLEAAAAIEYTGMYQGMLINNSKYVEII